MGPPPPYRPAILPIQIVPSKSDVRGIIRAVFRYTYVCLNSESQDHTRLETFIVDY